jgi:uncharacterized protein YecT (DUF1311 family)
MRHANIFRDIMKKPILIASLFILPINAFGQDITSETHPIEIKRQKCHEDTANQSTHGMLRCERIAAEDWDKELNRNYELLMATLKGDEKKLLKSSQLEWIAYRDKELGFSDKFYTDMEGTMWLVAAAGRRTNLIKQRALELKDYYDTLKLGTE